MKIVFTYHAVIDKFKELSNHGFHLKRQNVVDVVEHPDHIDELIDYPKIIVSKSFDKKHILRVVYKIEDGIIKIITFYPSKKGRYY